MADNVDISSAIDRLQNALKNLEGAVLPLTKKIEQLETSLRESESLIADRTEMAQQLDISKARENEFREKESEFNTLADETMNELDRAIKQVKKTLDNKLIDREPDEGSSRKTI